MENLIDYQSPKTNVKVEENGSKTNFERFNPETAGVTKAVNGLILVWSEELERFVLPVGKESPFQIIFDEPSGQLIQIQNADFIYRDRTASAPDGTTIREQVFIGRIPKKKPGAQDVEFEEVYLPDPEVQKRMIAAKIREAKLVFIQHLIAVNQAFFVGALISVGFFFWYLIDSIGIIAASFATGASPAIAEFGYFFVWGVGLVVVGFVAKYTLPALFRRRGEYFEEDPVSTSGSGREEQTINITVNQGSRTGGNNSSAQGFVDNRQI